MRERLYLVERPDGDFVGDFHLGVFHFALPEVPVVGVGGGFKFGQGVLASLDDFLGIAAGFGSRKGGFVFADDGVQFFVADFSFHDCTLSQVYGFVNYVCVLRERLIVFRLVDQLANPAIFEFEFGGAVFEIGRLVE